MKTVKTLLIGAALALPLAAFATGTSTTSSASSTPATTSAVSTKATTTQTTAGVKATEVTKNQLTLDGAKPENAAEIVKLAKANGATRASLTGNTLKFSGSKFDKEKFATALSSSLPGVSVVKN